MKAYTVQQYPRQLLLWDVGNITNRKDVGCDLQEVVDVDCVVWIECGGKVRPHELGVGHRRSARKRNLCLQQRTIAQQNRSVGIGLHDSLASVHDNIAARVKEVLGGIGGEGWGAREHTIARCNKMNCLERVGTGQLCGELHACWTSANHTQRTGSDDAGHVALERHTVSNRQGMGQLGLRTVAPT